MGNETHRLCFTIYAAAEKNLSIFVAEVSNSGSSVAVNNVVLRKEVTVVSMHP